MFGAAKLNPILKHPGYNDPATAVMGGASLLGGMMQSDAAQGAADTQARAADRASQMQWNEFNQVRQSQQPYMNLGQAAINPMMSAMGYHSDMSKDMSNPLNQQFSFDPSHLDQTPGYQFALQQGMQGINNSSAAKGLGMSSANMRDAGRFATGLADQTYGDQFNRALSTYQTNYNGAANNASRLAGVVQMGQNAAAGVGNQGLQTAMNSGNLLTSGAAAQGAGMMGSANAMNSALSNGMNYYMMNNMLNKMGGQTWPGGMYSGTNWVAS